MYRLALASLLALALMDMAVACPPAQSRVTVVDGRQVKEWFCPPGQVLYQHENVYRCFQTCDSCLNGFCHENKCHCFPGTQVEGPGVCGKLCPNCENGWCSSVSKCECNGGFISSNGRCVHSFPTGPSYNMPPGYPYWYPPVWDPRGAPQPNQVYPGYPQPNSGYPQSISGHPQPNSGYPQPNSGYPPYWLYGPPPPMIPNNGSGILPESNDGYNSLEARTDERIQ